MPYTISGSIFVFWSCGTWFLENLLRFFFSLIFYLMSKIRMTNKATSSAVPNYNGYVGNHTALKI